MYVKATRMPKGPNGQKRPADVIGAAIMVGRIATGELEEDFVASDVKDEAAKRWAARVAMRGTASTTPEQRSKIAREGAAKRWLKEPAD